MKSEILRLLKESDDYISGQQMCDRFHVSRTAVWKAIEQLKKEGYEIEAVRNRGYRLLSIYMTILLRPDLIPTKAPMLTLVMAQSVAEGIREVTGMETGIKWPNDIVMNKKKVCGILTEMSTEIDYINYVVIGVGINVNQKVFDEELKEKATSLMIETGAPVKRSALIAAVMKHFEINYALFMENGDLSGLQESYNEMLVNRGKEVRILEPGNEYNAHAYGINETGELIVRTQKGEEKHIFAGEVSVRGIYGYV